MTPKILVLSLAVLGSAALASAQTTPPASATEGAPAAPLPSITLEPAHRDYWSLRVALEQYQRIAARGGWPVVPDVVLRPEKPGMQKPLSLEQAMAIPLMCERLIITGDLVAPAASSCASQAGAARYGAELEAAVRRFQARHGLQIDGIVGPRTIAALNEPVESRIAQLMINLARWRQIPQKLSETRVIVNIPDFRLRVIDNGGQVLSMRVVTGKPATPTPIMSDEIRYLVFRPYWNVPDSITKDELLPKIAADSSYLSRHRFEVVDGWRRPTQVVDPAGLDWSVMEDFPYRLRQRPGPANSMGLVKFMFPNAHNIYLHDTPSKHRFRTHRRAYSHGCVRVEDPVALSEFLLQGHPSWSRERIESAMTSGGRLRVPLRTPVPVHLTYFTAWVHNGTVHFGPDIYGLDQLAD